MNLTLLRSLCLVLVTSVLGAVPSFALDQSGPVSLGDLEPVSARTGWFGLLHDRIGPEVPLILQGRAVSKGLLTHAPAEVVYALDGSFQRFQADLGLFDSGSRVGRPVPWNGGQEFRDADGSVVYQVWADGVKVFESPTLRLADSARVDVPIPGAKTLRLVVLPVESDASDWAVWGTPTLVRSSPAPQVRVEGGMLAGTTGRTAGIQVFRGIPYAQPPVGGLRWKPPVPVAPWKGVKDATAFGPNAVQGEALPFEMWSQEFVPDNSRGPAGYSEDCLTLNVWNDSRVTGGPKPVLVFLHGGAFSGGGSTVEVYDGESLAAQGLVVVTLNYRVGILGFLAHPELSAESPDHVSGNYGILDQIAALKWVQKNIAAFGGDPTRVTVAGQSAGSACVQVLLSTPLARGLFQRAITASDNLVNQGLPRLSDAEASGRSAAGGRTLAQLRALTPAQLLALPFQPTPIVDGRVVPQTWHDALKARTQNDVPLLTGMATGDRILFGLFPAPFSLSFDETCSLSRYQTLVKTTFGALAPEFLRLYPASNDAEASAQYVALTDDNLVALQAVQAQLRSRAGGSPTWVYHFRRALPDATGGQRYGAFHSADLPYWFGYFSPLRAAYWTDEDRRLGDAMTRIWARFARSGDPNGPGLPRWQPFEPGKVSVLVLDTDLGSRSLGPAKSAAWLRFYQGLF